MSMIAYLKQYWEVLTEHVGNRYLSDLWWHITPAEIHNRDMNRLFSSDVVIADVTITSLGVGYELGRAVEHHKPIVCLYKWENDTSLSAMIDGSPWITVRTYTTLEEAKLYMENFITSYKK